MFSGMFKTMQKISPNRRNIIIPVRHIDYDRLKQKEEKLKIRKSKEELNLTNLRLKAEKTNDINDIKLFCTLYNKYLDKYNYKNYDSWYSFRTHTHGIDEEEFKKDSNFINLKFWMTHSQNGAVFCSVTDMQNKFKTQFASHHNKYQFIKKSSITLSQDTNEINYFKNRIDFFNYLSTKKGYEEQKNNYKKPQIKQEQNTYKINTNFDKETGEPLNPNKKNNLFPDPAKKKPLTFDNKDEI